MDYSYISKEGQPHTIFHRKGMLAWEHPFGNAYMVIAGTKQPCPVCIGREEKRRARTKN